MPAIRWFGILPCLLALCVPQGGLAQSGIVQGPAAAASPRKLTPLLEGWRFHYGEQEPAVTGEPFDDSTWQTVSVPHTWNHLGEYGDSRSAGTNNAQGVGWYRLHFAAPAAAKATRQYLDFAAVGAIADVWVNGVHLGQHKGAFSRFRFDVTRVWRPGADNLIAVKADNSRPATGSSTQDVIPLAGDFFIEGGLYRGVTLISTGNTGIDLLDMGGPGVYARARMRSEGDNTLALVDVLTRLRNQSGRKRTLAGTITLRDAAGGVVAQGTWKKPVAAGASERAVAMLGLDHAHLWNGRADPYLYALTVEIRDGNRLVDSVTQPLGVRSFAFDANQGFTLNGQHLTLHGVSRHQDRAERGWALTRADHKQDMDLIAEMGANTVRMAHYQHDDAWADEADAHGMIAWAEVPYVTTPGLNGGQGSPALWANAEQQARELVRQMYNHPSITMWSIGNEVDASSMFGVSENPVKPRALLDHLRKVIKEEDPWRPTTFADCCEQVPPGKPGHEMLAGAADLIGYNRYFGWYMPQPLDGGAQLGKELDRLHALHPELPLSISEYGAGGAVSQHSDNVRAGFLNFMGRPQPEEFESFVHEENWPAIRARPFVFASWAWNMFDFVSDLRKEGDSFDLNTKGLVTFDRKTRKDAYYYYQAQWTETPMVHITSARHVDRAYPLAEVRIYSNAPEVALSIDGRDLGRKPCTDRICIWPDVALKAGPNRITATVSTGGQLIADSVTWNGPDASQGLRIDAGDLAGHTVDGARFGSDSFVTGGTPRALNIGGFGARQPVIRRVDAPHPELYAFWREGTAFTYAIPLPDGRWTVTVHSFAPAAGTTQTMMVRANGAAAVAAFNAEAAAGGALKGVARSFPVTVRNGMLTLDFQGTGGNAVVAAIEIAPITAAR